MPDVVMAYVFMAHVVMAYVVIACCAPTWNTHVASHRATTKLWCGKGRAAVLLQKGVSLAGGGGRGKACVRSCVRVGVHVCVWACVYGCVHRLDHQEFPYLHRP